MGGINMIMVGQICFYFFQGCFLAFMSQFIVFFVCFDFWVSGEKNFKFCFWEDYCFDIFVVYNDFMFFVYLLLLVDYSLVYFWNCCYFVNVVGNGYLLDFFFYIFVIEECMVIFCKVDIDFLQCGFDLFLVFYINMVI